eukprot:GFKZ01005567.1.p1 GENE.GFKZ01005567.1~~GFKZ01005567.1.p1  ORF type:complete len:203 (-),score=11.71 GFKZ01005567.1:141-749(-)
MAPGVKGLVQSVESCEDDVTWCLAPIQWCTWPVGRANAEDRLFFASKEGNSALCGTEGKFGEGVGGGAYRGLKGAELAAHAGKDSPKPGSACRFWNEGVRPLAKVLEGDVRRLDEVGRRGSCGYGLLRVLTGLGCLAGPAKGAMLIGTTSSSGVGRRQVRGRRDWRSSTAFARQTASFKRGLDRRTGSAIICLASDRQLWGR